LNKNIKIKLLSNLKNSINLTISNENYIFKKIQMLQRKPANRLGYNGINEIKEHPWLKYYPWRDLFEKNFEAPFSPKNQDNFDKKYCEGPDKIGNDTLERYQNYYKNDALSEIFINYSFENILTVQDKTKKFSNIGHSSLTAKKKVNNLSASINNANKGSINHLLKNKVKVTESLYLNNKISSSISSLKNTPSQSKNLSNNFNLMKTKNKPSISSASSISGKQISATPFRLNNEKMLENKLPFIDQKSIVSKHISSHSLVTKKMINSPNVNQPIKPVNKYSSLSSNSTGNSTLSMNFLHRRSGSTNTPHNY